MALKSLVPSLFTLAMLSFLWTAAPVVQAAEACGGAKTKAECGKKKGCSWSGKACATKSAAKISAEPTKTAKADAKTATPGEVSKKNGDAKKAGKPVATTATKKPTAPAEAAPAAAVEPTDTEQPSEEPMDEAPVEGEEDF